MNPRKHQGFLRRLRLSRCSSFFPAFLILSFQPLMANYIWNGAVNNDWFEDGNWKRDVWLGNDRRIPAGFDVVLANGDASPFSLVQLGDLVVDGTDGPTLLKTNLTLSGGKLSIINGARLEAQNANSTLAVDGSGTLLIAGIHADGRRSTAWAGRSLNVGQWGGTGNVIRVEDGGLIDADSLWMPGHTFTSATTHSTLVVTGVHASGVPSTVKAQGLVMGRVPSSTAEIQVLDGGVFELGHLGSYDAHPIVVAGSSGPNHRSTFRFKENGFPNASPKFEVLEGGVLWAGRSVFGVHVSGKDEWGNRSLVEARETFGGGFLVENDGIVMAARVEGSLAGSQLLGSGRGSSAIHLDTLEQGAKGGWLAVDGGTLVLQQDGSLSGDAPPLPTVIGGKGMWVETDRHVIVRGDWTGGTGALHKIGSGTLEWLGSNSHSGGTLVREGTLILGSEATTAAGVKVFHGASLGGSGVITGDLINQGTVSPGRSPGVLRIGGSFKQSASGRFSIEVDAPGASDLLVVGGNAMLGGTLEVTNLGVDLEFGDSLSVIRAANVSGSFRDVEVAGFDDFRMALVTSGNRLALVAAPQSYTSVATTANEREVASALDEWIGAPAGDRREVVGKLDRLSAAEYPFAFAAVSPGWIHASDQMVTGLARNQSFLLDQRLGSRQVMRNASGAGRNEWDAWGFGHGTFSNEHKLGSWDGELRSGGLVAGMDRALSTRLLAGGFLAWGTGDLDVQDGNEADVRTLAAGLYATYQNRGIHGNATFGAGYSDADSARSIRFDQLQRAARAELNGTGVFGSVSGGYSFNAGKWNFGPTAAVFVDWTRFESTNESGAGSLDLRVDDRSSASIRSMIGVETSCEQRLANGFLLVPQASLLWVHEFLGNPDELHARFAAGRGPGFTYDPESNDGNSVILSTLLNVVSPWDVNCGIGYHVQLDESGGVDHSITLGIDQKF